MKSSSELAPEPFHRVLLLGMPGVGKSTVSISTAPAPVVVMLCEEEDALQFPKAASKYEFQFVQARGWATASKALVEINQAVKEGAKTVVVDPLSDLGKLLENEATANVGQQGVDGFAAWRVFAQRLNSFVDSLFKLQAHVICTAHYLEKDGRMLPLLSGQMAIHMMKRFTDRVWMDLKGEERVFITGPTPTMSGPACRSSRGTYTLPASIETLFAHFAEMRAQAEGKPAVTVKSATTPARTVNRPTNVARLPARR